MPSTRSVPLLTGEVAPSIRIVEDFPAPFGPRNPNTSPRPNSKLIPSTARNGGHAFPGGVRLREALRLDHDPVEHRPTVPKNDRCPQQTY